LGGLNPSNVLLEKSTSSTYDKVTSSAHQEQSKSEEVFKLDQIYTCEQLGIGFISSKVLPESCPEFSHNLLKEVNQQAKEPVQLPLLWD